MVSSHVGVEALSAHHFSSIMVPLLVEFHITVLRDCWLLMRLKAVVVIPIDPHLFRILVLQPLSVVHPDFGTQIPVVMMRVSVD